MSLWQIFRWPLLIGALTATGLISGLVSDGWGDALAVLGLFTPAAVAVWFSLRRIRRSELQTTEAVDRPATQTPGHG